MFTAILGAIPAISNLLGGSKAASSAADACASALSGAVTTINRVVTQRNVAIAAVPLAFIGGFVLGRRTAR